MGHENERTRDFSRDRSWSGWKQTDTLSDRAALAEAERALFGTADPVRIGRYRIVSKIGEGAYGTVYAARDENLQRTVAIKRLRPKHEGADVAQRQTREAQALARLRHPNTVQVFDVGWDEQTESVFIAMEFVDGETLRAWLERRPHWRAVIKVFRQAAAGLVAIHEAGLVHRDFKPDNVLIDHRGNAKVADFGLAKSLGSEDEDLDATAIDGPLSTSLTDPGTVVGTPAYMALEVLEGSRGDAASDQFSFCVALYEALYSQRPYAGQSVRELQTSIGAQRLRDPPGTADVPGSLFGILARGLHMDPTQRWPSMTELRHQLRARRQGLRWSVLGVGAVVAAASLAVVAQPSTDLADGSDASALVDRNRPDPPVPELAADVDRLREALRTTVAEPDDEHKDEALGRLRESAQALGYAPVHAEVLRALAGSKSEQGRVDEAAALLEEALALATKSRHTEEAAQVSLRRCILAATTEPTVERARSFCEDAIATARRLGSQEMVLRARAAALMVAMNFGGHADTLGELESLLADQRAVLGEYDGASLTTLSLLADACERSGQAERAVELNRELVALLLNARSPSDNAVLIGHAHLGTSLSAAGRPAEALATYTESIPSCRPASKGTRAACRALLVLRSEVLDNFGRRAEALADIHEALALPRAGTREDDRGILSARSDLGRLMLHHDDAGAYAQLMRVADDAVAMLGDRDPTAIRAAEGAGIAALRLGKYEEADRRLSHAREGCKEVFAGTGFNYVSALVWSVRLEIARDDLHAARTLLQRAEQVASDLPGEGDAEELAELREQLSG